MRSYIRNAGLYPKWYGLDDVLIRVGDTVETLSGRIRKVESIDLDGYARLHREVSTFYVPHLNRVLFRSLNPSI